MTGALTILSTKILDPGARTYALEQGWSLREESFIDIRPLPVPGHPVDVDALVVFTSENGVACSPDVRPARMACLEGKTVAAARARWPLAAIVCTADSGQALAECILRAGGFTRVCFFCAAEHRPELPEALRAAGIDVDAVPVYATVKTPKNIDTPYDAVLFFSPSAVDSFFQHNRLPEGAVCFAIGQTTAKAVAQHSDARTIAGGTPSQEALLACVRFYYDNQQRYNEHTAK